ncbi:MAG: plastocyanin/azurin family copper-binding protein, partial [Verrucomicrobia bacterium]|nr:plastocyanin/azurin family copper-binding protein [Verrucomicrobiota bacterium]
NDTGIHLNAEGNSLVAKAIAESLAIARGLSASDVSTVDPAHLHEVALAAAAKHYRVAEVVRPKNGVVYFGVRARPDEYAEEMPRYHEMIRLTDAVVHQLAADPKLTFASIAKPSLPPLPERQGRDDGPKTGNLKPVAEAMAEFKTAPGYEVSVFASEEQFPEMRNPVQIAFDSRGRLWVVTMPSFPHTVPGLTPPDKIIILEDTDHDGKADKLTPFAEGLDALDGIAFHHDGVIISEQPRLWLMQDTDGDDRADTRRELLRGIDVTDSHHGGMIASDPMGAVIFSDGVFHRSQLETPFGVHRGMDATTYRLDVHTGKIITEWQHTTPNPWNVTFDRWGGVFQIYGDGDVYDGSSLTWTPLGAYHPYAYARITSYGKGSGNAMISSPNFPDEYQNGCVSASLLGRYAVTLSKLNRDAGMVKLADSLTILESPNAAFRPADVEFGMDGALYVSDFCSRIIGHAQHAMRDPNWNHYFGRIWRVVNTAKPLNKDWPKIEGATVQSLCALLTHPQDLVRHHARIELRKSGAKGLQAVDQWIAAFDKNDANYEQAALEAIFVCEGLGETRPALVYHLIKSKSEHYRSAAVHVIRIQADRLPNAKELLATLVNDPHPRVQVEVVGAIAHLRPTHPGIETILANITATDDTVKKSLAYLDLGIKPAKGRSVPVLEVAPESQLTHWLSLDEEIRATPETEVITGNLRGAGHFRTFIQSDKAQPAIIAISHKNLEIRLNDSMVFAQDSLWSGDQQVNVELTPGLNVIEIELSKGKGKTKGSGPPVFLYDPVGQALSGAKYVSDEATLRALASQHEKLVAERGNVIQVQAAAGLQFAPTQLRVTPGSKVRLVFSNPDIMMHNWVLLTPGSVNEVGALADQFAAQADAMAKGFLPTSNKILQASKLLGPNAKEELIFEAPKQPGEYPYICTFPGHWRIMKGVLVVAEAEARKTSKPSKPAPTAATTESAIMKTGEGFIFETAGSPEGLKRLMLPTKPAGIVTANKKTNNDPIATLTEPTRSTSAKHSPSLLSPAGPITRAASAVRSPSPSTAATPPLTQAGTSPAQPSPI